MKTLNTSRFDQWIRTRFCQINTELEELYFRQENKINVDNIGTEIKARLLQEAMPFIHELAKSGYCNDRYEQGFELLGNIGFYMAAYHRHEIGSAVAGAQSSLKVAFALALELGVSLGISPRFIASHLTTHNFSINGSYKSFTSLKDELTFIDYNTRGILAYKRAADALFRILPLGISHPVTPDLLRVAKEALEEVISNNTLLFAQLDTDRFFYNVRPYYKPHPVGNNVCRGANAGDFADINIIDLLLGLCQANQQSYAQLLSDKFLYMQPQDQLLLRNCMGQESLLDRFMAALPTEKFSPWFKKNASAFLEVCQAHGESARQHHNMLVEKYIKMPAKEIPETNLDKLTASGPPLHILLRSLENIRDQRMAVPRDDIHTRYQDIQQLKIALAN